MFRTLWLEKWSPEQPEEKEEKSHHRHQEENFQSLITEILTRCSIYISVINIIHTVNIIFWKYNLLLLMTNARLVLVYISSASEDFSFERQAPSKTSHQSGFIKTITAVLKIFHVILFLKYWAICCMANRTKQTRTKIILKFQFS